jgi:hypothetical protein
MKIVIRDVEAMKALHPLEVAAYLRSRAWVSREARGGRATIWALTVADEEYEALLPLDPAIGDFALRMGDLIQVLAAAEQRSQEEIYSDLLTTTADVVRIRIEDSDLQDGTLPIEVHARIAQKARDLMLAAACAATEARAVWHTRKPTQAVDQVRKVRIGQTERSSYVVTVITRVSPELHMAQGRLFETEVPFERRMTQTLASSLFHLERAAEEAALSGEFKAFDVSVTKGVSANLCDAVAGLWGEEDRFRNLEFTFSWSPARAPEPNTVRRVRFIADRIPVIREAGRLLRERAPVADFELEGAVVKLERAEGSPTGKVTILGQVEGKPRRVVVEMDDPNYHYAVLAHDQFKALRCFGSLTREGRSLILQDPHEITVVEE